MARIDRSDALSQRGLVARRLLVGSLLCLVAGGCAGPEAPVASYDSPRALADFLGCDFQQFTSLLGPGTQQGGCEYGGSSLSLTTATSHSSVEALADLVANDPRAADVSSLVGDRWILLSKDETALRQAQETLGGDLR